jgi:hypothetical protein
MIYMWFTGRKYYNLAVEKDHNSIFTTVATIWKPGFVEEVGSIAPLKNYSCHFTIIGSRFFPLRNFLCRGVLIFSRTTH